MSDLLEIRNAPVVCAKPRRRWLQFRLRSLLGLLTAAAALLAVWQVTTVPYRQHRHDARHYPAYIEPAIVLATLWPALKPRALIEKSPPTNTE